jgi:hypothetical protein
MPLACLSLSLSLSLSLFLSLCLSLSISLSFYISLFLSLSLSISLSFYLSLFLSLSLSISLFLRVCTFLNVQVTSSFFKASLSLCLSVPLSLNSSPYKLNDNVKYHFSHMLLFVQSILVLLLWKPLNGITLGLIPITEWP